MPCSTRRNGVTIEQCVECHGIFLDRGELERLIGAEASFLGVDPQRDQDRSLSVSGSGTPS